MAGYLNCLLLIIVPETKREWALVYMGAHRNGSVMKTCITDLKAASRSSGTWTGFIKTPLFSSQILILKSYNSNLDRKVLLHGLRWQQEYPDNRVFHKNLSGVFLAPKILILKFVSVITQHTFKQYDLHQKKTPTWGWILNWTEYQNNNPALVHVYYWILLSS